MTYDLFDLDQVAQKKPLAKAVGKVVSGKSDAIDLSPIFLDPLLSNVRSFVKGISCGTGIGKTYAGIASFSHFIQFLNAHGDKTPIIGIFTAPQHNQISFSSGQEKAIEKPSGSVMKVEPTSTELFGDLEKDPNAYDMAKEIFFTGGNKRTAFFKSVLKVAEDTDAKSKVPNKTPIASRIKNIEKGIANISELLGEERAVTNQISNIGSNISSEEIRWKTLSERKEQCKKDIFEIGKSIAINLLKFFEEYYKNGGFRSSIEKNCTAPSIKKMKSEASKFFPFLEYQVSGNKHVLLALTARKLMVKHDIFYPTLDKKKSSGGHALVKWSTRKASIEEIMSDKSSLVRGGKRSFSKSRFWRGSDAFA